VLDETIGAPIGVQEETFFMRNRQIPKFAIAAAASTIFLIGLTLWAQQDRYTLKVPNGLAFSEFKGYETWQTIAVSETETSVKAILGNPTMIRAYKEGIPTNGKLFPEGSKTVKIEWLKKKNPESPYFVEVPGVLKSLSFIEKDSKRFPHTHGWAYAQFEYDPASKTLKPSVTGSECGYACHTKVASKDYIFTEYPLR
jgi:Cytochrome P460